MEEKSTGSNASGSGLPETCAPLGVGSASGPVESSTPAAEGPGPIADADATPMDPAEPAPETSGTGALAADSDETWGIEFPLSMKKNIDGVVHLIDVVQCEQDNTVISPSSSEDPQTDTTQDVNSPAGPAESSVPAAVDPLLLTAGGGPTQPAESDDGGCFEPFILPEPKPAPPPPPPSPKPPKLIFARIVEEGMRKDGIELPPAPDAAPPVAVDAAGTDGAETVPPSAIPPAPAEEPLPPPRFATAAEIFDWLKRALLAHTRLTEDAAELACFCIFPTWFQDVLPVLPCQVITGSAPQALRVLDILHHFCREAELLAGIRRSQLGIIRYRCRTSLIWEPNLSKRTAELLSSLTDKRFLVVERSFWDHFARSTAVYAGENPDTHQIQNSIQIHITPTKADSSADPPWLQKMFERIPVHLAQYRERNLDHVAYSTWAPSGLSSEAATIAREIGRCIVDAPRLRQKLVTLLKEQETQRFLDMSTIVDAVVVEATQTLSHDGREHAYAREVAEKANRLFEARGETTRLSPEKVGHRWRKLGLRSRPLSQQGNGLVFDKATLASLKQLAAEYGMEDAPTAAENLNG